MNAQGSFTPFPGMKPATLPSTMLAVAFLLCLVSPYLSFEGHGIRNAWAVFGLWLLSAFFGRTLVLEHLVSEIRIRQFELLFLGFWILIIFFNAGTGRGHTSDLHLLTMVTMCMVVFIQLFYSAQRDGSYDVVAKAAIVALGVEVVRSLPALWLTPGFARMIMAADAPRELIVEAGLASVGQYGYYTGLAIVLPIIVSKAIASRGDMRVALWITAMATTFAISISTFMGAILLMLCGLFALALSYIRGSHSKLKATLRSALPLGIFVMVWSFGLAPIEQVTYIKDKIVNQFTGVVNEGVLEGDKTGRSVVLEMSFKTFIENPLWGVGPATNRENPSLYTQVGGHSSWLDQLAEYGFFGFGWYLLFLYFAIRRIFIKYKKCPSERKTGYMAQLISCGLFIIGGSYNPVVVVTETSVLFYFLALGE